MYRFDDDLKRYRNVKVPLNPVLIKASQRAMKLLYAMERDDDRIHVDRTRIPIAGTSCRADEVNHIDALVYEPKRNDARTSSCLLFIHGGGFVFNAAPHHFKLARRLSRELSAKVVMADYRLAPGHTFPTAHKDCLDVYKWLHSNAKTLKIDHDRIIVVGDSAGGNIAAALSLMAYESGLPVPKAQMLLYPVLDRRMQTKSYATFTDTPMCNSKDMARYFKLYAGDAMSIEGSLVPYISPLEAGSFDGTPPTYVEVAQWDCLHDEGVRYAQALKDAGIPVELTEVKDAMHGYDIALGKPFMDDVMAYRIAFLRRFI